MNRKGGTAHGLTAATTCASIGEPVDAALLMVPEAAIPDAFADMNAAGIRNAVVLTSGFAEMGAEGAARQEALLAAARAQRVTLLGPNCLGFINYADRVPIWTTQPPLPVLPGGTIGVVSQSGATAGFIAAFAHRQGMGLSYQVSTGNEADVNVARVVDFLVDDPATRVIGLFLETVHDAGTLAAAARRALAAGKPIVAIKIGASENAARAAQAHTGSLVGDDRVFDAICRQLGILRVASIEELVFTAGLLAKLGPVRKRKLGLISISVLLDGQGRGRAARRQHGLQAPPYKRTRPASGRRRDVPASQRLRRRPRRRDLAGGKPRPGRYDDAYLERIARTVQTLPTHSIVSVLDFHQDLYHERFQGEGAPTWAVLDDRLPPGRSGFPGNYFAIREMGRAYDRSAPTPRRRRGRAPGPVRARRGRTSLRCSPASQAYSGTS